MGTGGKPILQNENQERIATVPFFVHEAQQSRSEKTIKKLIIALVITIILLFLNNALWLWAWVKYDYSSEETTEEITYSQDGNGINSLNTGTQGDINYESKIDNSENDTDTNSDTQE